MSYTFADGVNFGYAYCVAGCRPTVSRRLAEQTAVLCKYIPVLWEIGIQVVVVAPGLADPAKYVALVDNQWAIIQSVFLVDSLKGEYRGARTWGQVITGKFQDAIERVLAEDFSPSRCRTSSQLVRSVFRTS